MKPIEERFWDRVNIQGPDECWEWQGSLSNKGYGQFRPIHSKMVTAHRFSFELIHGPIPAEKLVCHHCDNRKCVNPKHLFLGTYKDNTQDMKRKGRESNPPIRFGNKDNAKLVSADITQIRQRYSTGDTQSNIASAYKISRACIGKIVRGETWKELLIDTTQDNMRKGNERFSGELSPARKLTAQQVMEIRKKHQQGLTSNQIAKDYPVTASQIRYITRGNSWRTLK